MKSGWIVGAHGRYTCIGFWAPSAFPIPTDEEQPIIVASAPQPSLWNQCLKTLQLELTENEFNTWVRPLQAEQTDSGLRLLAPNRFVVDWVRQNCYANIVAVADGLPVELEVGSRRPPLKARSRAHAVADAPARRRSAMPGSRLDPNFTFDTFVEGKSNQLARAGAIQVATAPGRAYNPLCIYGGVGLGKTHLMHAIGNLIREREFSTKVVYVQSEDFVRHMVHSFQTNTIDAFKLHYRSLDALLIDDIQLFAGKERTQEEFFHTFNALLEGQRRIVLACDRYPKEVSGLEDRLKSRFGWGLTVAIEPPELETGVAILMSKAAAEREHLPEEVAFFIAQRIRSNVRELEGALRRVIANSRFTGNPITLDFTKTSLRDLLALQAKLVTIENIQRTVAAYFKVRVADLHSKRRSRSITRPRQIAMALARELTNHSLPELGDAFGGRDHTTVIHACRRVKALRESETRVEEDYSNLLRTLTG